MTASYVTVAVLLLGSLLQSVALRNDAQGLLDFGDSIENGVSNEDNLTQDSSLAQTIATAAANEIVLPQQKGPMCCLCADNKRSWSKSGSCSVCRRKGGITRQAPPTQESCSHALVVGTHEEVSTRCQKNCKGSADKYCAHSCMCLENCRTVLPKDTLPPTPALTPAPAPVPKPHRGPKCCLCESGSRAWSASGSCSFCAKRGGVKTRVQPSSIGCTVRKSSEHQVTPRCKDKCLLPHSDSHLCVHQCMCLKHCQDMLPVVATTAPSPAPTPALSAPSDDSEANDGSDDDVEDDDLDFVDGSDVELDFDDVDDDVKNLDTSHMSRPRLHGAASVRPNDRDGIRWGSEANYTSDMPAIAEGSEDEDDEKPNMPAIAEGNENADDEAMDEQHVGDEKPMCCLCNNGVFSWSMTGGCRKCEASEWRGVFHDRGGLAAKMEPTLSQCADTLFGLHFENVSDKCHQKCSASESIEHCERACMCLVHCQDVLKAPHAKIMQEYLQKVGKVEQETGEQDSPSGDEVIATSPESDSNESQASGQTTPKCCLCSNGVRTYASTGSCSTICATKGGVKETKSPTVATCGSTTAPMAASDHEVSDRCKKQCDFLGAQCEHSCVCLEHCHGLFSPAIGAALPSVPPAGFSTGAKVTLTTKPVPIGATVLAVKSADGFEIGDTIIIGVGSNKEENTIVSAFGSIKLQNATKNAHPGGAPVSKADPSSDTEGQLIEDTTATNHDEIGVDDKLEQDGANIAQPDGRIGNERDELVSDEDDMLGDMESPHSPPSASANDDEQPMCCLCGTGIAGWSRKSSCSACDDKGGVKDKRGPRKAECKQVVITGDVEDVSDHCQESCEDSSNKVNCRISCTCLEDCKEMFSPASDFFVPKLPPHGAPAEMGEELGQKSPASPPPAPKSPASPPPAPGAGKRQGRKAFSDWDQADVRHETPNMEEEDLWDDEDMQDESDQDYLDRIEAQEREALGIQSDSSDGDWATEDDEFHELAEEANGSGDATEEEVEQFFPFHADGHSVAHGDVVGKKNSDEALNIEKPLQELEPQPRSQPQCCLCDDGLRAWSRRGQCRGCAGRVNDQKLPTNHICLKKKSNWNPEEVSASCKERCGNKPMKYCEHSCMCLEHCKELMPPLL